MITYGTNPGMGMAIDGTIPDAAITDNTSSYNKSLDYMGFSVITSYSIHYTKLYESRWYTTVTSSKRIYREEASGWW